MAEDREMKCPNCGSHDFGTNGCGDCLAPEPDWAEWDSGADSKDPDWAAEVAKNERDTTV